MQLEQQIRAIQANIQEYDQTVEEMRVDMNGRLLKEATLQDELNKSQTKNRELMRTNAELQKQADLIPALHAQVGLGVVCLFVCLNNIIWNKIHVLVRYECLVEV